MSGPLMCGLGELEALEKLHRKSLLIIVPPWIVKTKTQGLAGSSSPVEFGAWANMSLHQLHPGKLPKPFLVHQKTISFASELLARI